ncbi:hypothetical protein PRUPE_3G036200 [Prunus persica]|uniref:Major facilitator superfamily (MFS) profile domain-containing protein n=1 Tax=Prunus persica TaxID=3760 RepID=A0A251PUP4_PRUPE|nr:hypothetical protein PRUPE_3G036200 [Prunus persica]
MLLLDLAFLSAYSIGMYFAGHVGDRIDLRLFLVFGMMSAVVGNWFEKEKRGLIMGIWSSHTSVGNIIDSVVASGVLEFGWGWSFVVPGVLVILVGILVFLFLPVNPEDLGFESRVKEIQMNMEVNGIENLEGKVESDEAGLLGTENVDVDTSADTLAAIGFWEAWRLPGVAPFALCLFFSKLVSYTFLYWLPFYVRHTAVFDIGGVFGGILAGLISDTIEARAVTSITFLLLSVPALVFYWVYGSLSMVANILLMFLSGLLVNGPYSLITTAVAADLVIRGNSHAVATVTAIIDAQFHIIVLLESPSSKSNSILAREHIPYSITTNYQKLIILAAPHRDNTARQSPAFATSKHLSKRTIIS